MAGVAAAIFMLPVAVIYPRFLTQLVAAVSAAELCASLLRAAIGSAVGSARLAFDAAASSLTKNHFASNAHEPTSGAGQRRPIHGR